MTGCFKNYFHSFHSDCETNTIKLVTHDFFFQATYATTPKLVWQSDPDWKRSLIPRIQNGEFVRK